MRVDNQYPDVTVDPALADAGGVLSPCLRDANAIQWAIRFL